MYRVSSAVSSRCRTSPPKSKASYSRRFVPRIYAEAYGQDPEFYAFYQTLDAYKQTLQKNASLLLTTSSDFYRYLKSVNGVVPHATAKEGPQSGPLPTQSQK